MNVEILGQNFKLQSSENEEYLREVLDYIQHKLAEIRQSAGTADPTKLAVLTAMLITDELLKLRVQLQEDAQKSSSHNARAESNLQEAEKITRNLIHKLIQAVE